MLIFFYALHDLRTPTWNSQFIKLITRVCRVKNDYIIF